MGRRLWSRGRRNRGGRGCAGSKPAVRACPAPALACGLHPRPHPSPTRPVAALFEQGISLKWLGGQYFRSTTYESNVLYPLRFMIDCAVVGGNWVELQPGGYLLTQAQVGAGQG